LVDSFELVTSRRHHHGIVRFASRNSVTTWRLWIIIKIAVWALCLTRKGFLSLPPHPGWGATSFCAVVNVGAHSWLMKWPKVTFIQKNGKGLWGFISVSCVHLSDIYLNMWAVLPIPCSKCTRQYDMIYVLTAIGLSPGGSSTVHIYTQTIHRTTQITTGQHK